MNVTDSTFFSNTVTPFNPPGKQAVGQENTELKGSLFASVEESSRTAANSNQKKLERPKTIDEKDKRADEKKRTENRQLEKNEKRQEVASVRQSDTEKELASKGLGAKAEQDAKAEQNHKAAQAKVAREKLFREQKLIKQLESKDQEARVRERANTVVGGKSTAAPTYEFSRGASTKNDIAKEISVGAIKSQSPQEPLEKPEIAPVEELLPIQTANQEVVVSTTENMGISTADRAELNQLQREVAAAEREAKQATDAERKIILMGDEGQANDTAEVAATSADTETEISEPALILGGTDAIEAEDEDSTEVTVAILSDEENSQLIALDLLNTTNPSGSVRFTEEELEIIGPSNSEVSAAQAETKDPLEAVDDFLRAAFAAVSTSTSELEKPTEMQIRNVARNPGGNLPTQTQIDKYLASFDDAEEQATFANAQIDFTEEVIETTSPETTAAEEQLEKYLAAQENAGKVTSTSSTAQKFINALNDVVKAEHKATANAFTTHV